MKKNILIYLFLLSTSMVSAQNSKVAIGVEVSPILVTLYGNEKIDVNSSHLSFSGGFKGEYFFNKHYSIKSGLLFSRKGAMIINNNVDFYGPNSIDGDGLASNFDYLMLPVLATFRSVSAVPFYVETGFFTGYLMNQSTPYPTNDFVGPYSSYDIEENLRRIDLGLALGLGMYIPIGENFLIDIGLKEELGLLNLSKYKMVNNGKIKTNAFGLSLGIRCKL